MFQWFACGSNADELLQRADGCKSDSNALTESLCPDGVQIVVGSRHLFVLSAEPSHSLLCCGSNDVGQCGRDDSGVHRALPVTTLPSGTTATAAAAGWQDSLVLTSSGSVYSFGGLVSSRQGPECLTWDATIRPRATAIACTHETAFLASEDGSVYGWGSPRHGLLPGVSPSDAASIRQWSCPVPTRISLESNDHDSMPEPSCARVEHSNSAQRVVQLAVGWQHAAALTTNGRVITWGSNKWGQCGRQVHAPIHAQVDLRRNSGVGVTGRTGHTAHAQALSACEPRTVDLPSDMNVLSIYSCWHSMAILVEGEEVGAECVTWGRGDMGQLGRGRESCGIVSPAGFDWRPAKVPLHCEVSSLSCGAEHVMAALTCGCLSAWGWNEHGNLGTGDCEDRHQPTLVLVPGRPTTCRSDGDVLRVFAGGAATFVRPK